ncbi:MAG: TIM barrel protein [Planctomycetes bacterium]|nr:TIM barrel protein [Planctomycetota bacterium]
MSACGKICIGTILLEKNRWTTDKTPTCRVSDWTGRFADAGFDGMELWQWHATKVDDAERRALTASPCPVAIFNSYAAFDQAGAIDRNHAALLARRFGAKGVKFNVGNDPAGRQEYMEALRQWRLLFDDDVTLLCECHPGTILEAPAAAKAFFDEAGVPGVGVIVHAFNAAGTLDAWLDTFGPGVRHAHLQMRDERNVIPFSAKPDVARRSIETLRRAGYDGSYTLEFTAGTLAPDETVDLLWANALADKAFLEDLLR